MNGVTQQVGKSVRKRTVLDEVDAERGGGREDGKNPNERH